MMQKPEGSTGTRRWRRLLIGVLLLGLVICLLVVGVIAFYLRPVRAVREVLPVASGTPEADVQVTPQVTTQRPGQSQPGRIVFVTEQGGLGTIAPDGSDEIGLGAEGTIYLFPSWSPDASRLAVIGVADDGAGVFTLQDRAEGEVAELYFDVQQAPIYLYWGPDGRQVTFIAQQERTLGLFVAPAAGGEEARFLAAGQPLYWDWAQDGRQLLVHSGTAGPDARLGYVDVSSGEEQGDNLAIPGYFQAPAVAGVEPYIAYAELDETQSRWLVVEDQETGTTQRTRHVGLAAMGWHPSGHELAFISPDRPEGRNRFLFFGPLRLFHAQSGELQVLTDDTVVAFFWSPDGEKIAYFTIAGSGQQQVARGDDARFARAADVQAQDDEFRLSLWLAYPETGELQHMIDFQPTRLFLNQFIPFFDQYARSHHLWSPDSSALVVPVAEGEGEAQIYVIPADGRNIRAITTGSIAFWSPQ